MASTDYVSGKSAFCLTFAMKLRAKKAKVAYIKPVGTLPAHPKKGQRDEDAQYISETLGLEQPLEDISPVLLSESLDRGELNKTHADYRKAISEAFARVSKGADVVLAEGAGDLNQGRFLGVGPSDVAELIDASVILVTKPEMMPVVDDIWAGRDHFGDRLKGVIFNVVPQTRVKMLKDLIVPYLEQQGIPVLGVVPRENKLQAVSVRELTEHLGGEVLCGNDRLDEMVEAFMVGAMGQEKALRFFRRKSNKAVITGGDRADVQLAALETSTKALILTGHFRPSPIVLSRAEELGVPVVLVDMDTLVAVEKTEELVGRVRVHNEEKLKRMTALVEHHIDLKAFYQLAGV